MMKKKQDERRSASRTATGIPIRYRKFGDFKGPMKSSTITRNLGEGGVCFRRSEFMPMACRLMVEINMPVPGRPVKAISKVAWIRKTPVGDRYEVGNQFLEISKTDKKRISEYINETL